MLLNKLTVKHKIYLLIAMCSVTFIVQGLISKNTLSIAKVHGPYYNRIVQGKDLIADILPPPNYIIETYLMTLHMVDELEDNANQSTMKAYYDRCSQLKDEFYDRHEHWQKDLPEGEMKRLKTVACYNPADQFYKILMEEFIPACSEGDTEKARQLARGPLRRRYETHRSAVDQVVALAVRDNEEQEAEVSQLVQQRAGSAYTLIFLCLLFFMAAGWYVARETVAPLRTAAYHLQRLATTDLANVSQRLRSNAVNTSDQALLASGAAEQVSANAKSLASAVEQFEGSIKEISGNASNAANVRY